MYEDQPARPPSTVELTWCEWHHGYADTGRAVTMIEQCSGPGAVQFACAPCRAQYQLVPWADQEP